MSSGSRNDEANLKKILCVTTNLKKVARTASRVLDDALAETGVNSTQYAILINVHRYEPISQMTLADHLELERTTLYRAVSILERDGYIKSTATGEGLSKTLELTAKGEKLTLKAQAKWETLQSKFTDSFGKKEWSSFLDSLEDVRRKYVEAGD